MNLLEKTLNKINSLDEEAQKECQRRLDSLTKPPGSLGVLEEIVSKLAGVYGESMPIEGKKAVMVMAGDHGVVEENVSAFPQEVTPQMVLNILENGAAINVLSRHSGAEVVVTDVGVAFEMVEHEKLNNCRVKSGTDNFVKGPAMSKEEAVKAIEVGIQLVQEQVDKGVKVFATGEMGIGNTTPSTAILAAFSNMDPEEITGRGTGIDDERLKLKHEVIRKGLSVNKPDSNDGLDVLMKVGGLEIAALSGVVLGAAVNKVPVVIDGFISGAAALIAASLSPESKNYMLASHLSQEPGHKVMLQMLGLKPVLHLDMRLGEGTGSALAFNIIDASIKILHEMATFDEAGVSNKE